MKEEWGKNNSYLNPTGRRSQDFWLKWVMQIKGVWAKTKWTLERIPSRVYPHFFCLCFWDICYQCVTSSAESQRSMALLYQSHFHLWHSTGSAKEKALVIQVHTSLLMWWSCITAHEYAVAWLEPKTELLALSPLPVFSKSLVKNYVAITMLYVWHVL